MIAGCSAVQSKNHSPRGLVIVAADCLLDGYRWIDPFAIKLHMFRARWAMKSVIKTGSFHLSPKIEFHSGCASAAPVYDTGLPVNVPKLKSCVILYTADHVSENSGYQITNQNTIQKTRSVFRLHHGSKCRGKRVISMSCYGASVGSYSRWMNLSPK